tara:strand:+ start:2010 stop:2219 length:210 start_codon:yes stop_codon:yes gene_type:complete
LSHKAGCRNVGWAEARSPTYNEFFTWIVIKALSRPATDDELRGFPSVLFNPQSKGSDTIEYSLVILFRE